MDIDKFIKILEDQEKENSRLDQIINNNYISSTRYNDNYKDNKEKEGYKNV